MTERERERGWEKTREMHRQEFPYCCSLCESPQHSGLRQVEAERKAVQVSGIPLLEPSAAVFQSVCQQEPGTFFSDAGIQSSDLIASQVSICLIRLQMIQDQSLISEMYVWSITNHLPLQIWEYSQKHKGDFTLLKIHSVCHLFNSYYIL